MKTKNRLHELAVALDQFGFEHDTCDYWDTVDDRQSNIESLERDLTDEKRIKDLKTAGLFSKGCSVSRAAFFFPSEKPSILSDSLIIVIHNDFAIF